MSKNFFVNVSLVVIFWKIFLLKSVQYKRVKNWIVNSLIAYYDKDAFSLTHLALALSDLRKSLFENINNLALDEKTQELFKKMQSLKLKNSKTNASKQSYVFILVDFGVNFLSQLPKGGFLKSKDYFDPTDSFSFYNHNSLKNTINSCLAKSMRLSWLVDLSHD